MKKILILLCCLTSLIIAFPYHVSEDVLEDVKRYEAAYEKSPADNAVIFELAMSYAYSGQIKEGSDMLNKLNESYADVVINKYGPLVNQNKSDWKTPFKLGFAYYFKKDKQLAIDFFNTSFERNQTNVWPLGYMGLIYGEQGNVDKTIELCKQALSIDKNATGIHFLLADAYKRKKKYFRSMKHLLTVGRLQLKKG